MRSIDEIAFRFCQETSNLYLLSLKPRYRRALPIEAILPSGKKAAEATRGTAFADTVAHLAAELERGRVSLFNRWFEVGKDPDWSRDYAHGISSGTRYFRRLPYLDFKAVGDHKYIWELNRHQHLIVLAQAYLLDGNSKHLAEISRQLRSWWERNPIQRGMNWASALEVAFRALSWIWVLHLAGESLPKDLQVEITNGLYQHARHLNANLSVYFSPNTHLLGEAVALHAIAVLLPDLPGASGWRRRCEAIIRKQLTFQVLPDGAHFEQSTYYHVYALDFFLLHYLLAGRPAEFEPVLLSMADYLYWCLGSNRKIFLVGDDDGGRLFHPYGERRAFGRATLATCGVLFQREEWLGTDEDLCEQAIWWLGPDSLEYARRNPDKPLSGRAFTDSGAVFFENRRARLYMDCGPFGHAGAGHSHSDSLSVCMATQEGDCLIDPGTFTYIGDPAQREWFRSSGAHNTVQIDGLNQATAEGPFRWSKKPQVQLSGWKSTERGGWLTARCSNFGFTQRRQLLLEDDLLVVADEVSGADGEHRSEQRWNLGGGSRLLESKAAPVLKSQSSRYSPGYGSIETALSLVAQMSGNFPHSYLTVMHPAGKAISLDEAFERLERSTPR